MVALASVGNPLRAAGLPAFAGGGAVAVAVSTKPRVALAALEAARSVARLAGPAVQVEPLAVAPTASQRAVPSSLVIGGPTVRAPSSV